MAQSVTLENGKTLVDARGDVFRGIGSASLLAPLFALLVCDSKIRLVVVDCARRGVGVRDGRGLAADGRDSREPCKEHRHLFLSSTAGRYRWRLSFQLPRDDSALGMGLAVAIAVAVAVVALIAHDGQW